LIGTERFLNLIAGNRLIFTHANPRRECVALAALGKFIGQPLQTSALREETAENPQELIAFVTAGCLLRSTNCTEY
jgi:hypothetical protein